MKTKEQKTIFGFTFLTIIRNENTREAYLCGIIKVAQKIIHQTGYTLYCFGLKVYHKEEPQTLYNKLYSKRFEYLKHAELKFLVQEQYKRYMGKTMDMDNPQTFNEKLCWLKVYYHDPRMTICADKVKCREFVIENIQNVEKHLVRQYGIYDSLDEIDFSTFPSTFVLKSNWGSGAQIIVDNKNTANIDELNKEMHLWLSKTSNHYYCAFEYGYKNIQPKIICEEFLKFEHKIEFFCFSGKPEYFWIIYNDKTSDVSADFYTMDYKKIPLKHKYPNTGVDTPIPDDIEEMIEVSKKLSGDFPFVRIDFYKTKNSWFFCEMTFVHWAGLMPFTPESYDAEFGSHIKLPEPLVESVE